MVASKSRGAMPGHCTERRVASESWNKALNGASQYRRDEEQTQQSVWSERRRQSHKDKSPRAPACLLQVPPIKKCNAARLPWRDIRPGKMHAVSNLWEQEAGNAGRRCAELLWLHQCSNVARAQDRMPLCVGEHCAAMPGQKRATAETMRLQRKGDRPLTVRASSKARVSRAARPPKEDSRARESPKRAHTCLAVTVKR